MYQIMYFHYKGCKVCKALPAHLTKFMECDVIVSNKIRI